MTEIRPPIALRAEIAGTIAPVRPLAVPGRRALPFVLLGAIWLVLVPLAWGVRHDASVLGVSRLWLVSGLQVAAAAALLRYALTQSIPGRLASPQRVALWAAAGIALVLAVTAATFVASPTYVPPLRDARYLYLCSTRTALLGLPALALAAWLLRRGLVARPVVVGALAGLAAGLLADSSWRVYCEVSDPRHVLTAHAGGIAAICAVGAIGGLTRRTGTRHTWSDE
jgi:hypothetical protein